MFVVCEKIVNKIVVFWTLVKIYFDFLFFGWETVITYKYFKNSKKTKDLFREECKNDKYEKFGGLMGHSIVLTDRNKPTICLRLNKCVSEKEFKRIGQLGRCGLVKVLKHNINDIKEEIEVSHVTEKGEKLFKIVGYITMTVVLSLFSGIAGALIAI